MVGLLLAAGGGRRAGGPKALRRFPDGSGWLPHAAQSLLDGGCASAIVVLGSQADEARTRLPTTGPQASRLQVVDATNWADGLAASLRTGLEAALRMRCVAVLVHLVDLPDVDERVVSRVLQHAPAEHRTLTRAIYQGRPGHPVLLGHDHLQPLLAELTGDTGARQYLRREGARAVECGDLASGLDVDNPAPSGE